MSNVGVLHLTDTLYAAGRQRVTVNVVNALKSSDYRVYLCTTRDEGPLAREVETHVCRLDLQRQSRFEMRALRRLIAFIQTHDIRLIHAHDTSLFMALVAALHSPYPAVIWHDHDGEHVNIEHPSWLYRLAAGRAHGVIAVSEELAAWACTHLRVPAERVWYMPNFIRPADSEEPAPEIPGDPASRIVCVGRLHTVKDQITLIHAMARVVRQCPQAHLILLGKADEGYVRQIHATIDNLNLKGRVSLFGEVHNVLSILRECSVGVLSSVAEGFPLVLLEYGVAGLPVVATHVGQCPEILDHGRAGRLAPPSAPGQLAEAIQDLLQAPDQASAMGRQLEQRVKSVYSSEAITEQLCKLYDATLSAAPRHKAAVSPR